MSGSPCLALPELSGCQLAEHPKGVYQNLRGGCCTSTAGCCSQQNEIRRALMWQPLASQGYAARDSLSISRAGVHLSLPCLPLPGAQQRNTTDLE